MEGADRGGVLKFEKTYSEIEMWKRLDEGLERKQCWNSTTLFFEVDLRFRNSKIFRDGYVRSGRLIRGSQWLVSCEIRESQV